MRKCKPHSKWLSRRKMFTKYNKKNISVWIKMKMIKVLTTLGYPKDLADFSSAMLIKHLRKTNVLRKMKHAVTINQFDHSEKNHGTTSVD